MALADPEPARKITPETIARMADELVGTPLKEKDRKAVAELLQSLAADMTALRALNVGENEPATIYDPAEAES
jgi:hypothetical protein